MSVLMYGKRNVILIGMPGAGKSTVGVVLAKRLGFRFLDSDLCIQEQEHRLLHEIIETEGTDGFLQVENRVNASLKVTESVIATGGSAVYGTEGMEHLKRDGIVIYLQLSCKEIEKRLGDLAQRGVVLKDGQTLYDLYLERVPLYETYADITIPCEEKEIRTIVALIAEQIMTDDKEHDR